MRFPTLRALLADPRHYQLAVLGTLLGYGLVGLQFAVPWARVWTIFTLALATQYLCTRWFRLPAFDPRSALISSLSLCLLLRSDSLWWAGCAAVVTIASKFLLRWRDKHIFNPVNFGLVSLTVLSGGQVWVSPGQWGSAAFFGFFLACAGGMVVYRALRSDVALAFLLSYAALLFGRALWLGDPLSIPLHQMQNGAFLLFGFFMISDPKTTPDSRTGRLLFAVLVALGAGFVHFVLYRPNGLIYSLAACALLVPLLDRVWPGPAYRWPASFKSPAP